MTSLRTGGLFLVLAIVAGMIWFWAELGSPMIFFLPPWMLVVDIVAAGLLVGITALSARRLSPLLTAWLPPVIVFAVTLAALNGFFLPGIRSEWFFYSVGFAAVTVGLPGVICATRSQLLQMTRQDSHATA